MLAIAVDTENGRRHSRVTAEALAGLVRRIGGVDDRFLVVQRIPDLPDVFLQVWHEAGGTYTLEYRDGGADRHFRAVLDAAEPVITAMTGWARATPEWSAGLDWERLDFEAPAPVPPLELGEEDRRLLETRLREVLVAGYATRAELAELAEDYLVSGEYRPVSREQARQLADRMWLERVAEQAGWDEEGEESDPERLTRAFADLESAGLTAREHFTCCHSCGQAEIGGAGSPDARGFVYFHSQATDAAAAGHGLSLMYGGFDGSERTTASVGREAVAALERCGLSVVWDGDPGQTIEVTPLNWRKRLVG
ncbi:hypothetical protein [Streptomyces sp. NBC_00083]|uniref:DUF6891 domain-containing protein n=1 Tax=Streptomyces sp. NBC_00083 TaxID=2975647 RepID=UPI00224E625E|nr:hypothetical protein [Streptomyces sp. NBC_00083]MCX5386632.1 hypothetical protein [Streptomyces sp. NBC_00083]